MPKFNQKGIVNLSFILLGLFLIANLLYLDYQILFKKDNLISELVQSTPKPVPNTLSDSSTSSACLTDCQNQIDLKINKLKDELVKLIPTSTPKQKDTNLNSTSSNTSSPKEIFIPLGIGGATTSMSWLDLTSSQITFDISNYPGAKAFYFSANLKSDASDRDSFARIYDATHFVGVQGSDISYRGLTSMPAESGTLTFLSGKITLLVQIHSLNGNLATLDNPRIRVVY